MRSIRFLCRTDRDIITWEHRGREDTRLAYYQTRQMHSHILSESSDSSESSSEMGDANEQPSAIMAQLSLMNYRLVEQDKEIKALREKLTKEETQHDTSSATTTS